MKKSILLFLWSLILLFSGCAVKQTDDDTTKVAKHVVNSPLYAVMAVGMAGEMAGGTIGYGVSKATDALAGEELYYGETLIGTFEQEQLDINETYAKFYQDNDYALYKDAQNNTYLYIVAKKILIKSNDISYFKRWSMATIEKRPKLIFTGIIIPESLEKEKILDTLQKDRFGNPIAWGDNAFITIRDKRSGWALSLTRTMVIIGNGAETVNMSDKNSPKGYVDQIRYYFKGQTEDMNDEDIISKFIVLDPNRQ